MADTGADPRLVKWAKWVTTIVGAPAAVVGFVLLVYPHVAGGGDDAACAGTPQATLGDPRVERSVRYGAYLELVDGSRGGASRERLRQVGKLIDVRVATHGFEGERLALHSWVLTANGEPVRESHLKNQLAVVITPGRCDEPPRRQKVWVRIPERKGRFKVELRLLDSLGTERDSLQTATFAGA